MGCSWWSYIKSDLNEDLIEIGEDAILLIPEYAQEWVGKNKLIVKTLGDYASFSIIYKNKEKFLNGHILIAIFRTLYYDKEIDISFEDCLFEDDTCISNNKYLEELRLEGIYDEYSLDYGLKFVTSNEIKSYEDIMNCSYCGQF